MNLKTMAVACIVGALMWLIFLGSLALFLRALT